jgi:peptide deformylase
MLVVDIGSKKKIKLANPTIIAKKGKTAIEEGCLSVLDKTVKVSRSEEIVVKALDENNKISTFLFSGLEAIAVQHEIDHLEGKIILDYLEDVEC